MSECNQILRMNHKPYPRTCAKCGIGPCQIVQQANGLGKVTISMTPEEFRSLQARQLRDGESLEDALLRLAGIRAKGRRINDFTVDPWLVSEAAKIASAGSGFTASDLGPVVPGRGRVLIIRPGMSAPRVGETIYIDGVAWEVEEVNPGLPREMPLVFVERA